MEIQLPYDRRLLTLNVPDSSIVYESAFPAPAIDAWQLVEQSLAGQLSDVVNTRRPGEVVIVVSDRTRPIPYNAFLPQFLEMLEGQGVDRSDIAILIATGMHRPSTAQERLDMFGPDVCRDYTIVDHDAEDEAGLVDLGKTSWSGSAIRLNRRFVEAGLRITTGLVEPHFMAGFSGGRKAVCPGLSSLETIQRFHGHKFLSAAAARNGCLEQNPCHEEAYSVAATVGVDLSINVVINHERQVVAAFSGELNAAHRAACDFVRGCSCPGVPELADLVVTCSGGYPLDATFYQCVKGMVAALSTVKAGGIVLSCGGCVEGIGSPEYQETMLRYANRWQEFLSDIAATDTVVKDQWQLQMHCRALAHLAEHGLRFITSELDQATLDQLSVNGTPTAAPQIAMQAEIDNAAAAGKTIAVIPEGPYCTPLRVGAEIGSQFAGSDFN